MSLRAIVALAIVVFALLTKTHGEESPSRAVPAVLYLHCIGLSPNGDGSSCRLMTVRVRPLEEFEIVADGASAVSLLTGRIERRNNKYSVNVTAKVRISSGTFQGETKLDERFEPEWLSGSGIYWFWFVLSKHRDPTPFLKERIFNR